MFHSLKSFNKNKCIFDKYVFVSYVCIILYLFSSDCFNDGLTFIPFVFCFYLFIYHMPGRV